MILRLPLEVLPILRVGLRHTRCTCAANKLIGVLTDEPRCPHCVAQAYLDAVPAEPGDCEEGAFDVG